MNIRKAGFRPLVASILAALLAGSLAGTPLAHAAPGDPPLVSVTPPAISGTAKVGLSLNAAPGTWHPEPDTVTYQWLRGTAPIPEATGATYAITDKDLGQSLAVQVTASAADREDTPAVSPATAKVVAGALASTAPTITGTLAVGSTLHARTDGWTPAPAFSYQWFADGKAISRATGADLKLTSSQHAKRISVRVTGKLPGYGTVSRTSASTGKVMIAGSPRVSGTLAVGSTVSVSRGSWSGKVSFSYQWLRDGALVGRSSSYRLAAADAGASIVVRVTGKRSGYATITRESAPSAKVVAAVTPLVSGSAVVGSKLKANPGTWSAGMILSQQWLRSGRVISGATGTEYTLTRTDEGKQISVRVTGRQAGWATVVKTSKATVKVMRAGTPTISGTAIVGSTVKVKVGSWSSKVKFSYQWYRNGVAISRATKSSYKLSAADAGRQLTVRVVGKRTGYQTATKFSAALTVRLMTLTAATPRVSGTTRVGSTLTAIPGTWTSGATLAYQWYADGDPISGATGRTYVPNEAEAGKRILVQVTGTKTGYATVVKRSAPTAVIPTLPTTMSADGYYRVGTDIKAGTYVAQGGLLCLWERRKNVGDDEAGLIADGAYHSGRVIVTLQPTDTYFYIQDCGDWGPLPTTGEPTGDFSEGDHAVGIHVRPGTYQLPGGPQCSWWRTETAGIDLWKTVPGSGGLHAWGPFHTGQAMVTIKDTDKFFTVYGCGLPGAPLTTPMGDEVSDGDYAIGTQIQPGTWRSTDFDRENCYYELASGFSGGRDEVREWGYVADDETELVVEILDTDVKFTTADCGMLRRDSGPAVAGVDIDTARARVAETDPVSRLDAEGTAGDVPAREE